MLSLWQEGVTKRHSDPFWILYRTRLSICHQSWQFGSEQSRSLAGRWARFITDKTFLLPESGIGRSRFYQLRQMLSKRGFQTSRFIPVSQLPHQQKDHGYDNIISPKGGPWKIVVILHIAEGLYIAVSDGECGYKFVNSHILKYNSPGDILSFGLTECGHSSVYVRREIHPKKFHRDRRHPGQATASYVPSPSGLPMRA